MKTCGNCLTSNERNSVVFFDSHDLYYCWGVTKKLDRNTIIKEWEYLLKKHPEADVLFFPHPKEKYDRLKETEVFKLPEIREINLKFKHNRRIIFHAFLWTYDAIRENAEFLKMQGFTDVQITPVQGVKSGGQAEWEYYQPLGLRFFDNPKGNKDSYISMCITLRQLGIGIIQDVIFRHCAGDDYGNLIPHYKVDDYLKHFVFLNSRNCEEHEYNDRYLSTHLATGMPIFNWWDHNFQKECIKFINELISLGISGLRIDQLKHFPTLSEGCDFLKNVFEQFEDRLFIYGEVINESSYICDKYINEIY